MSDWPADNLYGTSLPANPFHGQSYYYVADATNGVVWHLRYNMNSTSAYRWEFVGGADLYARKDAASTISAPTINVLQSLDATNLAITAPLDGDYEGEIGGRIDDTTDAAVLNWWVHLCKSSAGALSETEGFKMKIQSSTTTRDPVNGARRSDATSLVGVTANDIFHARAHTDHTFVSGSASFDFIWMSVRPIRVR